MYLKGKAHVCSPVVLLLLFECKIDGLGIDRHRRGRRPGEWGREENKIPTQGRQRGDSEKSRKGKTGAYVSGDRLTWWTQSSCHTSPDIQHLHRHILSHRHRSLGHHTHLRHTERDSWPPTHLMQTCALRETLGFSLGDTCLCISMLCFR